MNILVVDSQAKADAYSATIDGKLGYPKPGTDVGGGVHVPPAQAVTTRYGYVLKHPTLSQWAYPFDTVVLAQAVANPVGATVQTLDASWFPAATALP